MREPRCAAIADRLATPLRVAVSGRAGVGLRTAAHALARAADQRATVTVTSQPSDADLDVHVIAEVVKPEDCAAINAAGRPALTVLTKADLIAVTDAGCRRQGPTSAARARCLRLSARTGLTIEPLVGRLAVAVLDHEVDDALWACLQTLAGGGSVTGALRRRLVGVLDEFGTMQAIAAIQLGATRAETMTLLRDLSCIDEVLDAIGALGAQVHYQRILDAVADLQMLAVTDSRIGAFLAGDDTVVARMTAAMDVVEAAGMTVDRGDTADAHLRRALRWQPEQPLAGVHRACGADIVRGSLRRWAAVGGTV